MERKVLQDRLEKYYKGLLEPEEVRELIRYFSGDDVPEGFEADRDLFRFLAESSEEPENSALEERMSQFVDRLERKEHRPVRQLTPFRVGIAAAAAIALLVTAYLGFLRNPIKDTFNDPAVAYAETQRILGFVSTKLNEGTGRMDLLATAMEPAGELEKLENLQLPAEQLRKFSELNSGIDLLQENRALTKTESVLNKYLNLNQNK